MIGGHIRRITFLLVTLFLTVNLYARDQNQNPNIRVDGFASFVGGVLINDEPFHQSEYDQQLRFDQDSRIATQIKANMEDGLSATAQFIGRAADGYDVEMEWAFVKYQMTPQWSAKIGKVRAPLYMYSEHVDVGYAYHWTSPPPLLYDLPFDNLQGFQVEHLSDIGDWNSRWDLTFGTNREDYTVGDEETYIDLRDAIGTSWSLSYDWFTFRLGYAETGEVTIPSNSINNFFDFIKNNITDYGSNSGAYDTFFGEVDINEDRARFGAVGIQIDYRDWLAVAEYTTVDLKHSISPDQENYYVSIGKRFNKALVHLTYEVDDEPSKDFLVDNLNQIIPNSEGVNKLLALGGLSQITSALAFESEAYTVGLRYDFHPSADFKVEYKYQDDVQHERTSELLLFGVDVVF